MKDFEKEILEFIEDNEIGTAEAFRLQILISEIQIASHDRGMDKGEDIIRNVYNLK